MRIIAKDTPPEARIHEAPERLLKDRTKMVVAHRPGTFRDAGQFLIVDPGQIVEPEMHTELLTEDGV